MPHYKGMKTYPRIDRLLVPAPVAAQACELSISAWWELNKAGKLPRPIRFGTRATRWNLDELKAWVAAACPDRDTWEAMRSGGVSRAK